MIQCYPSNRVESFSLKAWENKGNLGPTTPDGNIVSGLPMHQIAYDSVYVYIDGIKREAYRLRRS